MAKGKPQHRREMEASRGGNTSNRPVKVQFSSYRFVRIEFTREEKDEFKSLLAGGEFDNTIRDDWYRSGYKLSVSYDFQHSAFIASLTGQYVGSDNAGSVLTARGNSEAIALAALEFKFSYICGDEDWKAVESGRGGTYDDVG